MMLFWAYGQPGFSQTPNRPLRINAPSENELLFSGLKQEDENEWKYLRGSAKVETTDFVIYADEVDFNSDTNWAYARGHVRFEHFLNGEKLYADHVEYNLKTEEGKFYGVSGTSPAKVMTSPGLLTTTNPFYFEGGWAERIKDRYILHNGFVTDCIMPKPWWTFRAPVFDIVPGERAIGHNTLFRLKRIPLFYLPYFYRPLGKNPRKSGFLTPSIGNSSMRGYMYGGGYYWAINRSYDLTTFIQYFTMTGPAYTVDFRGKPNQVSDFNFNLYSVQDNSKLKAGGTQINFTGKTEFDGFIARADINYLSSYLFRQTYSQSFISAVTSEVDSTGFMQRHFDHDKYVLNIVGQRNQLFESTAPNDIVIVQKLPSVEFSSQDQQIAKGPLPVWFSFGASTGLLMRQEPIIQNGAIQTLGLTNVMPRVDMEPRVMTEFNFKGISLVPSLTFGATDYGNSYSSNSYAPTSGSGLAVGGLPDSKYVLAGQNLFRHDTDFTLDITLPTLEKIYTPPKWLHLGTKLKHVIETRATYENVSGVDNFNKIIRFDQTDLLTNVNQLQLSITNRVYKKDKLGNVTEIFSWQVAQARYFDPTFGGTVLPGQRNVVLASEMFSPFAFLDGPRNYSPILSTVRLSPVNFISIDWMADYDPLRGRFTDSSITVNYRTPKYFFSIGQTGISKINSLIPGLPMPVSGLLTPGQDQIRFSAGIGNPNRRGFNFAVSDDYDFQQQMLLYQMAQVAYNTDCCGFSMQFRRFAFGTRNENQFLFSFAVANIGTFGTLQKQERIF